MPITPAQFREARVAVDLSLAEAAYAVDSTRSQLLKFEKGEVAPRSGNMTAKLTVLYEGMGVQFDAEGGIALLP